MECLLFILFIRYATTDKNEELIAEDKKREKLIAITPIIVLTEFFVDLLGGGVHCV